MWAQQRREVKGSEDRHRVPQCEQRVGDPRDGGYLARGAEHAGELAILVDAERHVDCGGGEEFVGAGGGGGGGVFFGGDGGGEGVDCVGGGVGGGVEEED